jgi:hypothetical protein
MRLNRQSLDALASHPLTHCVPARISDLLAIRMVKLLRWLADRFFRERYLHRAVVLKFVSMCPPGVAAHIERCKSTTQVPSTSDVWKRLLTFLLGERYRAPEHDSGRSRPYSSTALHLRRILHCQAECHDAHMHIFLGFIRLTLAERVVMLLVQMMHSLVFAVFFAMHRKMGYRLLGYLAEESTVMLTVMINDIDRDVVAVDKDVPDLALHLWGLEDEFCVREDSLQAGDSVSTFAPAQCAGKPVLTLREALLLMREDEMVFRDVNHGIADELDMQRNRDRPVFS